MNATGIKCGNCRHYHETVQAVRACHMGQGEKVVTYEVTETEPVAPSNPYNFQQAAKFQPVATDKQRSYIRSLATKRAVPVAGSSTHEAYMIARLEDVEGGKTVLMREASEVISWLHTLPLTGQAKADPAPKATLPDVPAGRYAVVIDSVTKFFKVDRPTEGKWAGYTFLKIQASDELYPVRDRDTKRQVLELIAQDPKEAMLRYGREIGACGHCGRTLTDEQSRAYGIGPICRGKVGF